MGAKSINPNQNIFKNYKEMYLSNSYRNSTTTPAPEGFRLDTLSSLGSTNVFTARRESDNAEQTFTYTEMIDGTYGTWLGGSIGHIKEWIGENLTLSKSTASNTLQPILVENAGNPYNNNSLQRMSVEGNHNADVTNDWIITLVVEKEINFNNQRVNLGIRGVNNLLFCFQMDGTGICTYLLNRIPGTGAIVGDGSFTVPTTDGIFRLLTFKYIGSVFSVDYNNTIKTLGAPNATYTLAFTSTVDNIVVLGNRGDNTTGKVNKYKHLSLVSGDDLSAFDVSAYNTEIMNRYGIV